MNMNTAEHERLITLLKSCNDPLAVECLENIYKKCPEYALTDAIPVKEVRDIYSRRQSWNESPSNPMRRCIRGYNQLLSFLPKEGERRVRVHDLKWAGTSILVFTDEETTSYFGLLIIPQK